jgi:hypothetical protein
MDILGKITTLLEKIGWDAKPKGWDLRSMRKYAKTLTDKDPTEHGWFSTCVENLKNEFDEPEKMCASLRDSLLKTTEWRGKGKNIKKVVKESAFDDAIKSIERMAGPPRISGSKELYKKDVKKHDVVNNYKKVEDTRIRVQEKLRYDKLSNLVKRLSYPGPVQYHKKTCLLELIGKQWPNNDDLIWFCDYPYGAYFGGKVDNYEGGKKIVTIYTD